LNKAVEIKILNSLLSDL